MWGATSIPGTSPAASGSCARSTSCSRQPRSFRFSGTTFCLIARRSAAWAILDKLIPRYPQVEGVEAIRRRVMDPTRRQGLIWHHQGTGKTLLMAFAALRLLNDPAIGGPTVVIVLDRVDLVEQTVRQFQTAGLPRAAGRGHAECATAHAR